MNENEKSNHANPKIVHTDNFTPNTPLKILLVCEKEKFVNEIKSYAEKNSHVFFHYNDPCNVEYVEYLLSNHTVNVFICEYFVSKKEIARKIFELARKTQGENLYLTVAITNNNPGIRERCAGLVLMDPPDFDMIFSGIYEANRDREMEVIKHFSPEEAFKKFLERHKVLKIDECTLKSADVETKMIDTKKKTPKKRQQQKKKKKNNQKIIQLFKINEYNGGQR